MESKAIIFKKMNLITLSTVQTIFTCKKKIKIIFLVPDSTRYSSNIRESFKKKIRFNVKVNDLCYFSFIIAIGVETRMLLRITSFVGF